MEAEGIWRGIWLEEAHHSTVIESNTLVLKQVETMVPAMSAERTVGGLTLARHDF